METINDKEWMRRELIEWRDDLFKRMDKYSFPTLPTPRHAKEFQILRRAFQNYISLL